MSVLTFPELRTIVGGGRKLRKARVIAYLDDRRIRYILDANGQPFTTTEALNAAMGVTAANADKYDPDTL